MDPLKTKGSLIAGVFGLSLSAPAQTTLLPGDLAIVGVNANNGACSGVGSQDEISFICFKNILANTVIWITDNGYERALPGLWGDTEGVVRMQLTSAAPIVAGTVITLRAPGAGLPAVVMPASTWMISSLNGGATFNMNAGGDQVFFLQPGVGGTWTNPGGAQDAYFTNCTLLYAFNTRTTWTPFTGSTQDSGLPPGSICFSMAPANATDFVKFTDNGTGGSFSTRSQRAWIIDIDQNTNWTSYGGGCTAYNAAAPNYAAGYTIPITAGGFVNGRWTGAKTTNWFDCRNWDDAEVPIATSNVVIDPQFYPGMLNCDIATGAGAVCQSLLVSTATTARNLTITGAGSSLTVGGAAQVQRVAGGGPVLITVQTGGAFTAGSLTVAGASAGGMQGTLRNESPVNTVSILGPVTIQPGGTIDLQGIGTGGTMNVQGNWTNNENETAFQDQLSTVVLNGPSSQAITSGGGFEEFFGNLTINKPSNDVVLNAPVQVRGTGNFLQGRVFSTAFNLPSFGDGAVALNASDASFVSGPVRKLGTNAFDFPVGKAGKYRPCGVSAIAGASTDAFTAEFFPIDPHAFGVAMDPTLDHISYCEYWQIDRSSGAPDAVVTLSWEDPFSCGVTLPPDLRVARWDGAAWRDRGNGGSVVVGAGGYIWTPVAQNQFSPWTLASVSLANPLPIELLWFTAAADAGAVNLFWATATESDNDFFTVERGLDGEAWTDLLQVDGAGSSSEERHYSAVDPEPLEGTSFYRLRQTDLDGAESWSDAVSVAMTGGGGSALTVFVDHGLIHATHGFAAGGTAEVIDPSGRVLLRTITTQEDRTLIDARHLPSGVYMLRIRDGSTGRTVRFVR